MKIKDIELFNISRYRAEHMGAAMLMVILFHVALPRDDMFFGLRRMGNIGVDIFLFLSGIGLWFSWVKGKAPKIPKAPQAPQMGGCLKNDSYTEEVNKQNTNTSHANHSDEQNIITSHAEHSDEQNIITSHANHSDEQNILSHPPIWGAWGALRALSSWWTFYLRRLIRVYPAWFIIACLYYIPRDLTFSATGSPPLEGLGEALGDILINWDFWLHDEGTFWYIPATMMLYIFAPPYMELIRRHPIYRWLVVIMIMWCILVQYVTPIHQAVGHIEIFWSRVPIFFLGINVAEAVRQKQTLDGQSIWMIIITFVMSLATSIWLEQEIHGHFPLFLERMLYIPLTVTTILLLNRVFRRTPQWVNKCFAFVGSISLEAYLIHIEFVLRPIERTYHLSYWPTFLLTVCITIPLAYILHVIIAKTTKLLIHNGKPQRT